MVVPFAVPALAAALLVAAPAASRAPSPRPAPARAAAAKPATKKAPTTRRAPRVKVVELYHVNTRETLRLRFVDDRGRPIPGVQRRADSFFRCHHTKKLGRMNPRLLRLLFETGRHFGGKRVEVVSGFRHPTVAKNPRSPHMKGLACDFRVAGVKNTELRDYLRRQFKNVGIGYYPNSSFIHLDVRSGASAFWIDYSGPGEEALYSENPGDDLRSGRADTWKPARIDPTWAEHDDEPRGSGAGSHEAPNTASSGGLPPVR